MAGHHGGVQYRETLDSLLEGFQIIGRDWTYLYVNPTAAMQGQSTPDALVGRRMWEVYPGFDESPLFAQLRLAMWEGASFAVENLFTYPDGTQRWFELRVQPVPEGLCIHSVDIDERKSAQAALERLNTELEARVAERTHELQQLNRELDEFTHSVSHDLRAPARHVAGFAEMLEADAAARLSPADHESIHRIVAASQRMTEMIDSLLAFARLGRNPVRRESVDLIQAVLDAQRDLAPDTGGRAVEWRVGRLPRVLGDPALLGLALGNLLSNALKYTRGRSPATIEIGSSPGEHAGEVVVWVRDNGVGFDPSQSVRLFRVFSRLHSDAEFEGTGVGLANVRRIVTRHGGRVWADARIGEGATFYVALPVSTDGTS